MSVISGSSLFEFPIEFSKNITDVFGDTGRAWLNELPEIFRSLQRDWHVEPVGRFPNLTYSFVAEVKMTDGQEAVLKVSPLCGRTRSEIAWYKHNPVGTPKLFGIDEARGAILIERLRPGQTLKQLVREDRDDEATEILAQAISSLSPARAENLTFKHVRELADDLDALDGKVDSRIVSRARSLFRDLTADASQDVSLHGDIHHDNVLSSGTGWRVIDPHGYVGPRCFEVGAMIRNPYDCFPRSSSLKEVISRRLRILKSNLPFAAEEISGWAYAYTLMATAWSVSDHAEVPKEHLEVLEALDAVL